MHRFTGNLLAAVGDATAGGVEGVALGCLSAIEAGEAVLELHEALARLKGLQLALLAHADRLEVYAQADGPAPVNTAAWLAHRGLVPGRAARGQVRHCRAITSDFTATGSALLAGDIDATHAEVVVAAVKRLPETSTPRTGRAPRRSCSPKHGGWMPPSCGRWGTVAGGHRPRRRRGGRGEAAA